MEEILINVEEQIRRSGQKASEDLISGAILTGGGSNLRDLSKAFKQYTKIGEEKIKFAKYVNFQVNTKYAEAKQADGTLNAILSLLTQGKFAKWFKKLGNGIKNTADKLVSPEE